MQEMVYLKAIQKRGVSVSGTTDEKTYLKNFRGASAPLSLPGSAYVYSINQFRNLPPILPLLKKVVLWLSEHRDIKNYICVTCTITCVSHKVCLQNCSIKLSPCCRTVVRKSSIGVLCICGRGLDTENLTKAPLVYSVSYFNLGSLMLCSEGLSLSNPSWRWNWQADTWIRVFCHVSQSAVIQISKRETLQSTLQ